MSDDPLPPDEQARLTRARVPVAPPVEAEEDLVAALRARGLLRRRRSPALMWSAAAAGILVGLVLAWLLLT